MYPSSRGYHMQNKNQTKILDRDFTPFTNTMNHKPKCEIPNYKISRR